MRNIFIKSVYECWNTLGRALARTRGGIRGRGFFSHYKSVASYHAQVPYIDVPAYLSLSLSLSLSLYMSRVFVCSARDVEVSKSNQESARGEYIRCYIVLMHLYTYPFSYLFSSLISFLISFSTAREQREREREREKYQLVCTRDVNSLITKTRCAHRFVRDR